VNKKIKIKRIYEDYNKNDGARILVDRLWPRGMKKEDAKLDDWIKDISPSNELRKWYSHDSAKWKDFQKKYFKELDKKKDFCEKILNNEKMNITLLYSAKNEKYNNAVALKKYLEERFL
jgi:uncharacterized protein YeaO (DUF488 family)